MVIGRRPTVMNNLKFWKKQETVVIHVFQSLMLKDQNLNVKKDTLSLLEVMCKIGAKLDLVRPSITTTEKRI